MLHLVLWAKLCWFPAGPGPFPGILDLWGMGGGLVEYRSALLASRGYASLSLAYFGHKDLPGPQNSINVSDTYFKVRKEAGFSEFPWFFYSFNNKHIGFNYFYFPQSAIKLLQDHQQVDSDRIGIMGLSYGVYLTLRIATQTDFKVSLFPH